MGTLSKDEMKAKSVAELIAYNQELMAGKDAISGHQLEVKAELNSRAALKGFNALPAAERAAIIQHINAGNLDIGG